MPYRSNGAANLAAVTLLPYAPFFLVLEIPGWVSVQILDQYEAIWIQAIQPDRGVRMGFTAWWIWTSSFRGSGESLRSCSPGLPIRRGHNAFICFTYRRAFFCRTPSLTAPFMLTEFRFRTAVPTRVLIPPPKRRMKRRMKRRRMKRATRRCIRGRTNRPLLVGHRPDQRTDSGTTRHAGINRCRTRSFGPSSRLMAHYRYNTVVPAPCLLEGLGKGRPCLRRTARGAPAASGAGYWRNGGASLRSATEGAKGRHDGGSPGTVTTSLKLASSAIESHARGACAAAGGRRDGDTEGKIQNLEHENPSIAHRWAIGAVRRYSNPVM